VEIRPRELSGGLLSVFASRTPTLPPATHTNSYALGGRDVVLVEPATPYDDEQREWIAWARSLASAGRRPLAILATHHHGDHVGGLDVFARELDLPVWAHSETAKRMSASVQRTLADGDDIVLEGPAAQKWRVLHTPGHAPGHVCLHEERASVVIVGDMVASVGTILIAPDDGDMREYLAQLARLAELSARLALPAHGAAIDDPSALFRDYIAHRLARESKILAALAKHGAAGATPEAIVADAYDDVPATVHPVALLSVRSHLAKLVDDGRVLARDESRYIAGA